MEFARKLDSLEKKKIILCEITLTPEDKYGAYSLIRVYYLLSFQYV